MASSDETATRKSDRTGLFSEQMVTIRTGDSARMLRIPRRTQILFALTAVCLLGWTLFATAVTVRDLFGFSETASVRQAEVAMRLDNVSLENAQLIASNTALRTQLIGSLELLYRQTGDQVLLEQDLAEAQALLVVSRQMEPEPVVASIEIQPTATELPDQQFGEDRVNLSIDFVLGALDLALAKLGDAEDQVTALEMENAALLSGRQASDERTAYAVSRILDMVTNASEGFETIFTSAGLSPDELASQIRSLYISGNPDGTGPVRTQTLVPEIPGFGYLAIELERLELNQLAYLETPFEEPVRRRHEVAMEFGDPVNSATGEDQLHAGVDLAASTGTPIHATGSGVVTFAGENGEYGMQVVISHIDGISSSYSHLNEISVEVGDRVSQTDVIGDMGSSGLSSRTHLHYEVRIEEVPVDPMKFIEAKENVFKQEQT